MTVNGKSAIDNVRIKAGASLKAEVAAIDKENDSLTYVGKCLKKLQSGLWEVLMNHVRKESVRWLCQIKMCMRLQLKFPENIVCTYMYLIIRALSQQQIFHFK